VAQGTSYRIAFDLMSSVDGGHHWVTFRHFDQYHKYTLDLSGNRATLAVHNGPSTPVAISPSAPFALPRNTVVHVELLMSGFTFSLSGAPQAAPVLVWTDPYSAFPVGPSIGYYTSGSCTGSCWDNIIGVPG
jgi:hypothetical protein